MQDILVQYGLEILGTILVMVFGWVGSAIKKWVDGKQLTNIARTVVTAVEQIYTDIHGEEKLDKALEMFSVLLKKKHIKVSAEQMKILIESAVGEFNEVFYAPPVEAE